MKKGEIYEGVIEKIDFQNKGRVKIKDTTVTVKKWDSGAESKIYDQQKNAAVVWKARLLEVLEKVRAGKERSLSVVFFPSCGGCMYQTMLYEEQLKMKEEQIKKLFDDAVDMNILLSRSKEARSSLHIATKWNFLLGMNTKTGHCHLDFIKKAAHMMC